MLHITREIRNCPIHFYNFIDSDANLAVATSKVDGLLQYFARMPNRHLEVLYPILIVKMNPIRVRGTDIPPERRGGGTCAPGYSRGAVSNQTSGVRREEFREIVPRDKGFCLIPENRWIDSNRCHFTVMHEVGHCIDFNFGGTHRGGGLHPSPSVCHEPTAAIAFAGIREKNCGGQGWGAYQAEAYARMMICPHRIVEDARQNARIIELLMSSPAFAAPPIEGPEIRITAPRP
jgi:hypothetical protein